jgi:hypothetical protein
VIASASLVVCVLLLAAGAASAARNANFPGAARAIVPPAAEARYRALTGSSPAEKPPADKRAGFRSGWQASYLKGTPAKPIEAYALVYVYDTPANARRAYDRSCRNCTRDVRAEGIRMKFQLTTSGNNQQTVVDIATCRNVYAAIAINGQATSNALATDAGLLAGAIFRRAIARGMTSCGT